MGFGRIYDLICGRWARQMKTPRSLKVAGESGCRPKAAEKKSAGAQKGRWASALATLAWFRPPPLGGLPPLPLACRASLRFSCSPRFALRVLRCLAPPASAARISLNGSSAAYGCRATPSSLGSKRRACSVRPSPKARGAVLAAARSPAACPRAPALGSVALSRVGASQSDPPLPKGRGGERLRPKGRTLFFGWRVVSAPFGRNGSGLVGVFSASFGLVLAAARFHRSSRFVCCACPRLYFFGGGWFSPYGLRRVALLSRPPRGSPPASSRSRGPPPLSPFPALRLRLAPLAASPPGLRGERLQPAAAFLFAFGCTFFLGYASTGSSGEHVRPQVCASRFRVQRQRGAKPLLAAGGCAACCLEPLLFAPLLQPLSASAPFALICVAHSATLRAFALAFAGSFRFASRCPRNSLRSLAGHRYASLFRCCPCLAARCPLSPVASVSRRKPLRWSAPVTSWRLLSGGALRARRPQRRSTANRYLQARRKLLFSSGACGSLTRPPPLNLFSGVLGRAPPPCPLTCPLSLCVAVAIFTPFRRFLKSCTLNKFNST